jgi:RecA/RadA recombinase
MSRRKLLKKSTEEKVQEAVQSVQDKPDLKPLGNLIIDWDRTLSTGSTLLDLAISSGKVKGGGVPGGILVEVYGRSGSGKTSILSELCGSAQAKGGEISYQDPESRLDTDHAKIYGATILKENYHRPDTVTEMFERFKDWNPSEGQINVMAADSLAALSTDLELEKGDKMGMRRAKEFSQELRKNARLINKRGWLLVCSNQVRQGDYGDVTPGGKAVEFYSSLRISVNQVGKVEKEKVFGSKGKKVKRIIGIISNCIVTKSSIDKPYREAPIVIKFDYGIDDIHANLQWLKDTLGLTKYKAVNTEYQRLDDAIKYIETNDLEEQLRNEIIELWNEIEEKFKVYRKPKRR